MFTEFTPMVPVLAANAGFKKLPKNLFNIKARPSRLSKFGTEDFIRGFWI